MIRPRERGRLIGVFWVEGSEVLLRYLIANFLFLSFTLAYLFTTLGERYALQLTMTSLLRLLNPCLPTRDIDKLHRRKTLFAIFSQ